MPLIPKQNGLAQKIDLRAKNILSAGGDDEALLMSLNDIMGDIKKILDSNTRSEMDLLCQQYDGFYRYMKLLEKLASGIACGKIQVPSS